MRIINPGAEDYHTHSLNYSDGLNTIDEMVIHAGKVGLEILGITDHSRAMHNYFAKHYGMNLGGKIFRGIIKRWRNVDNDVEVIFGVEGDLLNEDGDICHYVQQENEPSELLILSAHDSAYSGDNTKITQGFIKAIERFHEKITFIGHPCALYKKWGNEPMVDIDEIIKAANDYGLPMEMDCANMFVNGITYLPHLERMLERADLVVVNSDAHHKSELEWLREKGFEWLRENKVI
jgi:histidinol phosphatase-like PHP family hydrolase